uniref:Uncharacterized protein n=1 Tax=Solanum lycopersicum TaxID=4081 RepID=A0A3Q7EDK6_SOLLC
MTEKTYLLMLQIFLFQIIQVQISDDEVAGSIFLAIC